MVMMIIMTIIIIIIITICCSAIKYWNTKLNSRQQRGTFHALCVASVSRLRWTSCRRRNLERSGGLSRPPITQHGTRRRQRQLGHGGSAARPAKDFAWRCRSDFRFWFELTKPTANVGSSQRTRRRRHAVAPLFKHVWGRWSEWGGCQEMAHERCD